MANITEILGTDSLSSSRITINGNFSSLNNELADISTILDTTTSTIAGLSSVSSETITIQNGGTQILNANTNAFQIFVSADFDKEVSLGGRLIKNGVNGTAVAPINTGSNALNPSTAEYTTYIINDDANLPAGLQGQEITIVNEAVASIAITGNLGATTLTLDSTNANVTLRFIGSKWYVISYVGATIVL
jgi:hypothetical protein